MIGWIKRRIILVESEAMTDQEKRVALAVAETTPLWQAINAVIDEHIDDAQQITRNVQTAANPSFLAHSAGGMDALKSLKEDLSARREDAVKASES